MIQKRRAVTFAGKSIASAHEKREFAFMYKRIFTNHLTCKGIMYDMVCPKEMTISRNEISSCRFAKIEDVKKEVNEAGETFNP